MKKIAAIKSLKAIEIRATTRNVGSHYVDRVNAESILKPLIRFAEEPPFVLHVIYCVCLLNLPKKTKENNRSGGGHYITPNQSHIPLDGV
jgi:hypothetical protein